MSKPCSPDGLRTRSGVRLREYLFGRTGRIVFCSVALAGIFTLQSFAGEIGPLQCWKDIPELATTWAASVCTDPSANSQVRQALKTVCLQNSVEGNWSSRQRPIVIGFLGGFAKGDDINHPEIWFARYLSERYASAMYAEVFSNRETELALRKVYSLLDTDCDGTLTEPEKQAAGIILFGHSWGASQTVAFARELAKRNIPVLLTVQIDIVAKPGQRPFEIPSNVRHAVNFFQPGERLHFFQPAGILHGRSRIVATDPASTTVGNFRMTYRDYSVDCGNFPWLARTFNKPHHEIENDSRVWEQINSLIDMDLKDYRQRDDRAEFPALDSR